jgi:5-amino-6-(5-phosphoribosylamino)uracil reductase
MARRPFVLASAAMSADGYIDDASPRRLILSSPEDLDRVDAERAGCDAIMVGAQTVRSDNPRLLVTSESRRARRVARGLPPSPVKVTLTASGDLDCDARLFAADGTAKLVYAAAGVAGELSARLEGRAEVIGMPEGHGLAWVLADLGGRGIGRLMIEGGSRLLAQALSDGLADEFQLAVAPVFVADPAAPRLLTPSPQASQSSAGRADQPGHLSGFTTSGRVAPTRMVLAGVTRAGDMAVLRYLPRARPAD